MKFGQCKLRIHTGLLEDDFIILATCEKLSLLITAIWKKHTYTVETLDSGWHCCPSKHTPSFICSLGTYYVKFLGGCALSASSLRCILWCQFMSNEQWRDYEGCFGNIDRVTTCSHWKQWLIWKGHGTLEETWQQTASWHLHNFELSINFLFLAINDRCCTG